VILNKFFIFCFLYVSAISSISAQNIDYKWIKAINGIDETRGFSKVVSHTTTYVSVGVPVAMSVVALIEHDDEMLRNSIYVFAANTVFNTLFTQSIKGIANRPRPFAAYPDDITQYDFGVGHSHSFPSGHTSQAFATATALTLKYPRWYVVAPSYAWACSVGYSRMNLGVHYPSDVAVGAALGAGSAYITYLLNEWFWKKTNDKKILAENQISEKNFWY
jgi:membrane-associated phospholipid phosphatase